MRIRVIFFLVILCCIKVDSLLGQRLPYISTGKTFDVFFHEYYKDPKPHLVSEALSYLKDSDAFAKENAVPPLIGFFAEVFAENPDSVTLWRHIYEPAEGDSMHPLYQAVMLSKRKGSVLDLKGDSPQLNDMYWGGFFATGNPQYIQKLIGQLDYCAERKSLSLFLVGSSAKWSLASNSKSHRKVLPILEDAYENSSGQKRKVLQEILSRNPDELKAETIEIIKRQKDAGIW